MRILNLKDGLPLNNITVYLTPAEALQAIGYLEQMLEEPEQHHSHLNDDEYQHEITLTVYQADNLEHYDERSKTLILTGD